MTEPAAARFSIGDLAQQSGTKVETIRYYEKAGLMPSPARTAGNHRAYSQTHADRLAFIRHGRQLGFSLESVRTLLALADEPERDCANVDAIAREPCRGARAHCPLAGIGSRVVAHDRRVWLRPRRRMSHH
jgi:DNA-binding transcriptional MerR regulator